jgi:putative Holliday junction resolvase
VKPILGIDFGSARIGLAISDELQLLAHPLATVSAKENVIKRIAQIVQEKKIEKIVVGIPKNLSGEIGKAANEAIAFVERLRAALSRVEIITWDERLTTVAANRTLRDLGRKIRDTRRYVDQVAAQMILQGYLDRQSEAQAQTADAK